MNSARFTINGTPSEAPGTGDPGYLAANSEALTIALENAEGVLAWVATVADPLDSTSPQASKAASPLTWAATGTPTVTVAPQGSATLTLPAAPEVSSYVIRVSAIKPAAADIYERGVYIPTADGTRKTVPAETTQFVARGWSDALNDMVDSGGGGGGGGGGTGFASGTTSSASFAYVGNAIWIDAGTYAAADCVAFMGSASADSTYVVRLVGLADTIPVGLWTSASALPAEVQLPGDLVITTSGFYRLEHRLTAGAGIGILHGIKLPL